MKQKLLNSIRLRVCMLVAVLCTMFAGQAWADTKTEGFEGKTAGTNYQSTVTISESESDCGIGWEIYYGCVSTSNKITGSKSAALRLYTSNNYGYIKTTTPIEGLSKVSFKAKAQETNGALIKVNVEYSADGSSWSQALTNSALSSTLKTYEYNLPSGSQYFRIIIRETSTKPSKSSAQLTIDDVVFTYTPPADPGTVATPTFSVAAGTYTSTQSVELSTETEDASIYYTTNGDTPTSSSTPYTSAISVSETMTIKAIAVKDGLDDSEIASATYTIVTPLTTMDAIFSSSESTGSYYVTLNNWVVSGVSGNQAFVTDGTKGFIVYKSGHGFVVGNILSGTVQASLTRYQGSAEITNLTSTTTGLTVTTGGTVSPQVVSIDDLSGVNTGALIQLNGVTYDGTDLVDNNDDAIRPYTTLYSGSYTNGTKYNVVGVYQQQSSAPNRILPRSAADIVEVTEPTLLVDPATATAFTYVEGGGPSDDQMFAVTGTNLVSADITATVSSDYEITDDESYYSSVTVASGDIVSVRLKAGLAKGTHNGTLTFSSTGATNVVVNLSGSVTGQTYTISVDDDVTGGSIEADLAKAAEGATVTLTATPDAAYTFGSWIVYEDDMSTEVTVTDNKFTMPDCEVYVTATFNAKPTYAVTCAYNDAQGLLSASPTSAYEGQTVTLSYAAEDGYELSSIVITKTLDGTATGITPTASGDDYTFTMPGYAVTATATFEYNLFEGSFAKVTSTSALEDGGYYILYSTKAMNSTVTSGKMGATAVTINNDIIENPNKSIVWTLVKNGDNWDLYNEKEEQYCYIEGTNTSAFKMAESASYHFAVTTYAEGGGFKFKTTHSSNRGINYGSDNFGSYADSNDPTVYLYKYTVLTPRTITFNGNGGTYNEASTYTEDVYDGVEATLDANLFTRSGYAFAAWNTKADGSGDEYDDKDAITVSGSDLTLYAQWAPLYTLTIDDAIVGGSVAVDGDVTSAVAGAEITLTNTPSSGYGFSAWDVYKAGDTSTKVTVTDDKFTMPSYNVVISATFEEVQTYTLLTNANQLVSGKHYIIASGTNGSVKAMGSQNTNNRVAVSVTASSGIIPETDGVYEFVIYGPDASGNYEIFDDTNSKYLYAASSSDNHLKMQTPNNANGKWSIAIGNTGIATIKAKGSNTRNTMQYNSGSTIFSCYGSASQSDVYLYEKDGEATPTESVIVTAAGYATYVSDNALDFSESSINAYIAIADGTTGVTFSQITKVPANTGVLLYKDGGATESIPSLAGAASDVTGNVFLRGTGVAVASVDGNLHNYILNKPSEKPIGFYRAAGQTVAKNRAYIQIDESTPVKEFISLPWDDVTGVNSLTSSPSPMSEGSIFNLAGQKMSKLQKGVNIVNGKKVLVK